MIKQPKENIIEVFFHCANCIKDKPQDVSPREWARLEAGWTVKGIQVWCARCEMNIINLDFKGEKVGTI